MHRIKKTFNCLVFLIVTVFGVGKIKYAPGTFGSLTAFPIGYLLLKLVSFTSLIFIDDTTKLPQVLTKLSIILMLYLFILFLIGTLFSKIYLQGKDDLDPKEVVIDELVGQLLTLSLCSITIPLLANKNIVFISENITYLLLYNILPFILFRFFDIAKPWPVGWIDKNIKGALGVMLDDIAAAILATIIHWSFILIILDFNK
jgi:phosphatidylglycerophosphatase A